jgi:hypothetical protein
MMISARGQLEDIKYKYYIPCTRKTEGRSMHEENLRMQLHEEKLWTIRAAWWFSGLHNQP